MHNHDNKYPARPGFEPDNPRLQALVDTNEPLGSARILYSNDIEFNKLFYNELPELSIQFYQYF